MKNTLIFMAIGVAAISGEAAAKCASVRIETPDGPKTFTGMIVKGPPALLGRVSDQVRTIGLRVIKPRKIDGEYTLNVFFDDSIVDGGQALSLYRRLTVGDLAQDDKGKLQVASIIGPITERASCTK